MRNALNLPLFSPLLLASSATQCRNRNLMLHHIKVYAQFVKNNINCCISFCSKNPGQCAHAVSNDRNVNLSTVKCGLVVHCVCVWDDRRECVMIEISICPNAGSEGPKVREEQRRNSIKRWTSSLFGYIWTSSLFDDLPQAAAF